MAKELIRIQKVLSDAGVASRRKAEELVAKGKVTVNGRPAKPGHPVDPRKDLIAIDGVNVVLEKNKKNYYIVLNKPRGYVTTTSDELGRRCVTELVKDVPARVYPVGRLDRVSEGLLLLTNDGQFANRIMHPSSHVSKTYRVTVREDVTDEKAAMLAAGLDIGEGDVTQPCQVLIVTKEPGRTVMQITISEGKNRQIRRMCEAVGLEVVRLRRISVGPVKLGMLAPGKWRELTPQEVGALKNSAEKKATPAPEQKQKKAPRPAAKAAPKAAPKAPKPAKEAKKPQSAPQLKQWKSPAKEEAPKSDKRRVKITKNLGE